MVKMTCTKAFVMTKYFLLCRPLVNIACNTVLYMLDAFKLCCMAMSVKDYWKGVLWSTTSIMLSTQRSVKLQMLVEFLQTSMTIIASVVCIVFYALALQWYCYVSSK